MTNWGDMLRRIACLIGSEIRDNETGEFLGKAILFAFRGRVWVIGYTGKKGLRPVPVIKKEIRYWVQEMRFAAAEEPDFPRKRDVNEK
jgi:hypothetical protein